MEEHDYSHLEKQLKKVRRNFDKTMSEYEKELGLVRKKHGSGSPLGFSELREKRMAVLRRDFPEVADILLDWETKYGAPYPKIQPTPQVPFYKASKFLRDFLDG